MRGQVNPDSGLKLTFPRWVRVGPALVKTDLAGRLRTVLTGRGDYSADLAVPYEEPIDAATVVFTLEPRRGEFALTLTARASGE